MGVELIFRGSLSNGLKQVPIINSESMGHRSACYMRYMYKLMHMGVYYCERYGFQAVQSGTGYGNQKILV